MASAAEIRKLIAEILENADLNAITAKKVRQELESKLDTDLTERKKEIDNMVMEILQEKQNSADGSSEDEKVSSKRKPKDSDDDDDEDKPKKRTKKSKKSDDSSDEDAGKRKKKASAKEKGKRGGTGYTKLCTLSPELSKVMGEESMARHEVVKKMWTIIKEKNLYDPKNRQFALCNADLLPVFGVKRFRTFGMMKYLKNHFTD